MGEGSYTGDVENPWMGAESTRFVKVRTKQHKREMAAEEHDLPR